MKRLVTLLMMLILGASSAFGYQSYVNLNLNSWYGLLPDLQAPYRARVNSDDLRNALYNQQINNASNYLLSLGIDWITNDNVYYVADMLWGEEIREQVALYEGNSILFENSVKELDGFWVSPMLDIIQTNL